MSRPDAHDHPHAPADDPHAAGSAGADDAHVDHARDEGGPGSHDGHGFAPSEALGPVDRRAWAAAIGGAALAVILVVALYLTIPG